MAVLKLYITLCTLYITASQTEKYSDKVKTYKLQVPGKESITIIETTPLSDFHRKWDLSDEPVDVKDDVEIKNLMTHIIHDGSGNNPRCYGPSCPEDLSDNEESQQDMEDIYTTNNLDKLRVYHDFSKERLQAINALAAKLKKDKFKTDRYSSMAGGNTEDDNSGKIFTSWNRLKVKQHKHPFDDKDGWVTLEPVAWSTSKISKWKPNVKKQKPNHWNEGEDNFSNEDKFTSYQDKDNSYTYTQERPTLARPGYINNKLHVPIEYVSEIPSKPLWTKPSRPSANFQSWAQDESRRPHKPNCDTEEHFPNDDSVYYELSDSLMTDSLPSNFPYEYEALHQSPTNKRPNRRPTQVMYGEGSDFEDDRSSRPPFGDGHWVLLSTTKGYRNKKRQRSLNPINVANSDYPAMTSHQAVALTVLPVDDAGTNMTTSHGGLLEVERSFQTVEESKIDMDKNNDLDVSATQQRPIRNKVIKKKFVQNTSPDSSTVFAAVGAGMLPATMAMVVPMMLGRRRRRRDVIEKQSLQLDHYFHRYQ